MQLLNVNTIHCPYCGQVVDVVVDNSAGDQEYIEDCSVCCRPIVVRVGIDSRDHISIEAHMENE